MSAEYVEDIDARLLVKATIEWLQEPNRHEQLVGSPIDVDNLAALLRENEEAIEAIAEVIAGEVSREAWAEVGQ